MKLGDWLNERKGAVTQDAFARSIGLTQGRISQIIKNGTREVEIALKIERATEGAVPIRETLGQPVVAAE